MFIKDAGGNLLARLLGVGASLIASVSLARGLGIDDQGLFAALIVWPSLLITVAELGLGHNSARALATASPGERAEVATIILVMTATTAIVGGAVCYVLLGLFAPERAESLQLVLAALLLPVMVVRRASGGVAIGMGSVGTLNRQEAAGPIVRAASLAALATLGILTVDWALALTGAALLGTSSAALWQLVKRSGLSARISPAAFKSFSRRGLVYAFAMLALNANYRIDVVLLSWWATDRDVGVYSVASAVAELVWQVPSALGIAVLARSVRTRDRVGLDKSVAKLFRLSLAGGIIATLALVVSAQVVVPILYGSEFSESAAVIAVLSPGIAAIAANIVLTNDLSGRGRPGWIAAVMSAGVILNVALNAIWIPSHGAYGAAMASTVSYLGSTGGSVLVYSRLTGASAASLLLPNKTDFFDAWASVRSAGR